jgi:hypothetical protein
MVKRLGIAATVLLLGAGIGWSGEGIRGRAAVAGTLVEGVLVRAYPYRPGTFGPLTGEAPAGLATTATDGTYELSLPPGRYVVDGLKAVGAEPKQSPRPNDLYCLYSGSPIVVSPGAWTAVGLNLVAVSPETRRPAERSAVSGKITFAGEAVERAYLYVYTDVAGVFHGPAHLTQPVAAGSFQVRLPPGTYHLVARKRARGGAYGPIQIGDLFNFYPLNPLTLAAGEEVSIEIPLIERLSQLEEDPKAFQGVRVRVLGPDGSPAKGFYVLAYSSALRAGPPAAVSSPTDGDGRTRVPAALGTTVYLRARQSVGGPPSEGETFADAEVAVDMAAPELVLRLAGTR